MREAVFRKLVPVGLLHGAPRSTEARVAPGRAGALLVGRGIGLLQNALDDMFDRVQQGQLRVIVGGTYALADASRAHIDLQSRRTTGKLLLDPTV